MFIPAHHSQDPVTLRGETIHILLKSNRDARTQWSDGVRRALSNVEKRPVLVEVGLRAFRRGFERQEFSAEIEVR